MDQDKSSWSNQSTCREHPVLSGAAEGSTRYPGERKQTVVRDGKKIKAEEKHLWTEVRLIPGPCEARTILEKLHPQVFEAYDKQGEKANELQEFITQSFMMDIKAMKFTDHMKLCGSIFEYRFRFYKYLLFFMVGYLLFDLYIKIYG